MTIPISREAGVLPGLATDVPLPEPFKYTPYLQDLERFDEVIHGE